MRPKYFIDPRVRLCGSEIAHDDEHRIVGPVKRAVERDHVVERCGAEVLRIADDAAPVRMRDERFAIDEFVEHPVWFGQNALVVLADHDVAFGVKMLLGHGKRTQPVGLGPQQRLEIVRRHDFVVVGDVLGGERVVEAPDIFGRAGRSASPGACFSGP